MFALPSANSPLRNFFDVSDLAEMASPKNRGNLRTFRQALDGARLMMHNDRSIKSVHSICVTADGMLRLIRVGPKGGVSRLWNFGAI